MWGTIHSVLSSRPHHFLLIVGLLLRLCLLTHMAKVHTIPILKTLKDSSSRKGVQPINDPLLLHTWAPTSAADSTSVGKPTTTLIGTSNRAAILQAACKERLITKNQKVLASVGTTSATWCTIKPQPPYKAIGPLGHRTK